MQSPLIALPLFLLVIGPTGPNRSESSGLDSLSVPQSLDTAAATQLLNRQPGFFVRNLGQWNQPVRFVHRSGPMTLFLKDRGWVIDLVEGPDVSKATQDSEVEQKARGVALEMIFAGATNVPEIIGEKQLRHHHNYLLGNDRSRWHTGVPLYTSVRYAGLYPGIDLRLREADGVPEYDLLLEPGADLSRVSVAVEGAEGLSIASDGSLVIETALGPVSQPTPKTWQVGADGRQHEVACNFRLLGVNRFGFLAPAWDRETHLTIDPGLIWSTYLGGDKGDWATAIAVDASGLVTVAGSTNSTNFPTTNGAYDTTANANMNAFVSRLDPSKTGSAQLIYSTFLGGSAVDYINELSVAASGEVTVAGATASTDFPTTSGAYDTTHNGAGGNGDAFVARLDPSQSGSAQLVYSTFLGGASDESINALAVDASGVITVAGHTWLSTDFPTTSNAFDTTHNGGSDIFVSRLDPSQSGSAQLVYSTFVGSSEGDWASTIAVDVNGVVTIGGETMSANFPTTSGAYDTTYNGYGDVIVCRLDPRRSGSAQLVYATFLGGLSTDRTFAVSADANGVVTVAGVAFSPDFPTTIGAYDTIHSVMGDAFVSRLDPSKTGSAQLIYSTLLGENSVRGVTSLAVDANGVVTVAGDIRSANLPTTSGAYDTTFNGAIDGFISRLDPSQSGSAQLVYSTFLGGTGEDTVFGLSVDAAGVVTVAGTSVSANFPTTSGAFDTTYNGGTIFNGDAFISRISMGASFYADRYEVSIQAGGTQNLTVDAGLGNSNKQFLILGSITGTDPGTNLFGLHIPLNLDWYTSAVAGSVNSPMLMNFMGTLDANGLATASFNLPASLPGLTGTITLNHAYVVYDLNGFAMASNAVPLVLK